MRWSRASVVYGIWTSIIRLCNMTTINKYVNVCLLIDKAILLCVFVRDLLTNLIIFTVPSVPLSSSRN